MKRILPFIIILIAAVVFAQDSESTPEATTEATAEVTAEATDGANDCPNLVKDALKLTALNCDATDTNQACYGFIDINAETRSNTISFTNPGDIVDVLDLQGVQLSPMNLNSGLWGLMVMDVAANMTDGSTALDNVQIVLYGDSKLTDASHFVQVVAKDTLQVYEKPRQESTVIDTLAKGDTRIVNSQLEDGSWLRIRFNDESTGESLIGWLEADKVAPSSDLSVVQTMTAAQAEETPSDLSAQYGPMQAFVLETGKDDAPCQEAPNSGVAIQTPAGGADVTFVMDEVVVTMNGTGVISAQADGNLSVIVVDGEATVEHDGDSSTATTGQAVDVALDSNSNAVGTPNAPRNATAAELQGIGGIAANLLDDPVSVPNADMPSSGTWRFVLDTPTPLTCPDGTEVQYIDSGVLATIEPQIDGLIISGFRYNQVATGVYSANYSDPTGNFTRDTLRVVSSINLVGDRTIDLGTANCSLSVDYHYEFVSSS